MLGDLDELHGLAVSRAENWTGLAAGAYRNPTNERPKRLNGVRIGRRREVMRQFPLPFRAYPKKTAP